MCNCASHIPLLRIARQWHMHGVPYVGLRFWWNFKLTKFWQNSASKLSAIFRLLPKLFPCYPKIISWEITYNKLQYALWYFNFNLNIVAKFRKDSILRASIYAKLSLKYWQHFRCPNTGPTHFHHVYFSWWNGDQFFPLPAGLRLGQVQVMGLNAPMFWKWNSVKLLH